MWWFRCRRGIKRITARIFIISLLTFFKEDITNNAFSLSKQLAEVQMKVLDTFTLKKICYRQSGRLKEAPISHIYLYLTTPVSFTVLIM